MTDDDNNANLPPAEELAKLKEKEEELNTNIQDLEGQEKQAEQSMKDAGVEKPPAPEEPPTMAEPIVQPAPKDPTSSEEEEPPAEPESAKEETPTESEAPKEEVTPAPDVPTMAEPIVQPAPKDPTSSEEEEPPSVPDTPAEPEKPGDADPTEPATADTPAPEQPADPADMFRANPTPAQKEPEQPSSGPASGTPLQIDDPPDAKEPPKKTPEEEEQDKKLLVMAAEKGQEAFEKMEEKRGQGCNVAAAERMLAKSREYMTSKDYMNALNSIGEAIQLIGNLTPPEPALPDPVPVEQQPAPQTKEEGLDDLFAIGGDEPPAPEPAGTQEDALPEPAAPQGDGLPEPAAPPGDEQPEEPAAPQGDGLPDPTMGQQPQPAPQPAVQQPLLVAACWNCQGEIPVHTEDRPTILTCPGCGEQVQLD